MTAEILDGRAVAATILDRVASEVARFTDAHGRAPLLATVLVGDDPASHTYVRMKANRCATVGMRSRRIELDDTTTTEQLVSRIRELSDDPEVDGILLQHPVPGHIDERAAFEAIVPSKDVDGVTRASFAAMAFDEGGFRSATPGGIMALLDAYDIPLEGRHAVVVGRSPILGKPVGMLLLARDATVTYCHSRTVDLAERIAEADVVVAAVGRPGLIRGDWIKPGAVVVDAGYADNTGDVDYTVAAERASYITPVPGGVGPMTIATLLEQTIRAAWNHQAAHGDTGNRPPPEWREGATVTKARDDYLLDLEASRRGYALNRMCGSFMREENRRRFSEDEAAYCDAYGLSPEQKRAVLARDWTAMLELGGSIFYIFKLAMMDKKSMQYLGGVFTGMSAEEFTEVMRSGGRKFG